MPKLKGQDLIAAILLIGAFTGKYLGYDGILDFVILGVALAYGVVAIPSWRDRIKGG